jgi:hypothetical protein
VREEDAGIVNGESRKSLDAECTGQSEKDISIIYRGTFLKYEMIVYAGAD